MVVLALKLFFWLKLGYDLWRWSSRQIGPSKQGKYGRWWANRAKWERAVIVCVR